jgi:hypothetical protein
MLHLAMAACLVAQGPTSGQDDAPPGLRMSKPVACAKVHGFASFEPLPGASLTSDEKLTVYYEPSGYAIEKTKDGFRALFSQDGRIRKKGGKDALWQKAPMFEYEAKNSVPPYRIYMRSDFALKGLPPGDYELDLTLHDRLTEGTHVMKTLAFKIVPPRAEAKEAGEPAAETPAATPKGRRQKAKNSNRGQNNK